MPHHKWLAVWRMALKVKCNFHGHSFELFVIKFLIFIFCKVRSIHFSQNIIVSKANKRITQIFKLDSFVQIYLTVQYKWGAFWCPYEFIQPFVTNYCRKLHECCQGGNQQLQSSRHSSSKYI